MLTLKAPPKMAQVVNPATDDSAGGSAELRSAESKLQEVWGSLDASLAAKMGILAHITTPLASRITLIGRLG